MNKLIEQYETARQNVKSAFAMFMANRTRENLEAYNNAKGIRDSIQSQIMNYNQIN